MLIDRLSKKLAFGDQGLVPEPDPQVDQKSHHAFADLVVMAELLHPIPFRTRP
jgi:hypothetical protein